jgi:hypothetical protein
VPVRHRYKTGRPTKRTKEVVKILFDAIKEGVPYKLACMAAGITYDCFLKWRRDDPDFDRQVEELVAKPAIDLFKIIREQAPETWQAGAWTLERRFPEMFAKPEAQLNVIAQAAVVNGNGAPHNVQMVVVSDLEFVGLKRHPAYTHRPGVVRQAEQEVPPELAGTLERENRSLIVTSESAAKARARRYAQIRARTKELLETSSANTGKLEPPTQGQLSPELDGSLCREDENIVVVSQSKAEAQKRRLAEAWDRLEARHSTLEAGGATNGESGAGREAPLQSEPVPAVPTGNVSASSALSQKPAAWWRQFVFPGALIPKADATLALRLILSRLRIPVDERVLDFKTDQIVQTTFCEALEKLPDSDLGWRTMTQIYERELRRTDHQR